MHTGGADEQAIVDQAVKEHEKLKDAGLLMFGARRMRRKYGGAFFYSGYGPGDRSSGKDAPTIGDDGQERETLPFAACAFADCKVPKASRYNYTHVSAEEGPGVHAHATRVKARPLCVRWNLGDKGSIAEWAEDVVGA